MVRGRTTGAARNGRCSAIPITSCYGPVRSHRTGRCRHKSLFSVSSGKNDLLANMAIALLWLTIKRRRWGYVTK